MAEVKVYGVPGSPYLRAVLLGLEEKGTPYDLVRMSPPETKHPAHLERHPFGRIPVIEHCDFSLYETQAILRYVDKVFPGVALQPDGPRTAARMDRMVGIVDWYFFREAGVPIAFNRVVAPVFGIPVNEEVVKAAIPKAENCVRAIDGLLGDDAFLAGDALSIADLMLAPQLDMFSFASEGADILSRYPRLGAWLGRMQARDSMCKTTWEQVAKAA